MERRKIRDWNLFRSWAWYMPGIGGMFALLLLLIGGMLLGSMVTIAVSAFYSPEVAQSYGMLVSYPLQFLPAMVFVGYKSRMNALFDEGVPLDDDNFGKWGGLVLAVAAIIATLAAQTVSDLANMILPPLPDMLKKLFESMTGGPVWVSLLLVSVFAPFFEEWLCRGEILRGLLRKMKPAWAIIISAVFFALIHGNPWQAIPAFLLGCIFGYVYYRTGSLKLTMLMHCTNNTLAVILAHIDGIKDAESLMEVIPQPWYAVIVAVSVVIVAAFILMVSRIPLKASSPLPAPGE